MCALALAHIDLQPFQRRLLRPDAAQALRELHELNSHELLTRGELVNAFWADHAPEMQIVTAWLQSPEVQSRILQQ
jgi:hypothetical protein